MNINWLDAVLVISMIVVIGIQWYDVCKSHNKVKESQRKLDEFLAEIPKRSIKKEPCCENELCTQNERPMKSYWNKGN